MNFLVISIMLAVSSFVEGDFSVSQPRDYMMCKPISGIFSTLQNSDNGVMAVLQGPEGRRGPQGKTGLRGPRGSTNYDAVNKLVSEKLEKTKARIYKLEADLQKLPGLNGSAPAGSPPTESPQQKENRKQCKDLHKSDINIGTTCYRVLGKEGLLWSQDSAERECKSGGGNLADLASRTIYDKLYNYIDENFSQTVQAWTGMTYEKDQLLTSKGGPVPYAKWSSGYPRKSTSSYYASYTKVYIFIDTSAYARRLLNSRPTTKIAYAICSYELKGDSTTAAP